MLKKHTLPHSLLFILFIFSFQFNLLGQTNKLFSEYAASNNYNSKTSNFNFWDDAGNGINDFENFFTSPLHYSENTWLKIGAATAITGGLFFIDNSVRSSVKKIHSPFQDSFVKIGDNYGKGIIPAGFAVALYGFGFFADNYEIKSTGQILFESLAAAGITVTALKVIFGRSRPYLEEGSHKFNFFKTNNDFNSFPSGHVIIAFTTSTVLAERIGNIYASAALYGLAALTAYQRIYTDNHWFSDTFLAAAMGIAIGKYFVNLHDKRNVNNTSAFNYSISPTIVGSGLGVSFNAEF